MNPARMRARGIDFVDAVAATLPDFQLTFNKKATGKEGVAYANVSYAPGNAVEGIAYLLADPADIVTMDPFEGSPVRYSREVYVLSAELGSINAWVYVANRAVLADGLLPERNYLNHLLAGKAWHSESYHQRLLLQPCIESDETSCDEAKKQGLLYNV